MTLPDRLIVFTRYPEAGRNKTRLIPMLGAEGAAQLHERMTRLTLAWADTLAHAQPIDVQVQFTGADESAMAARFGAQFRYVPQCDGDLGARLEQAIGKAFQEGCQRVVVVGTDCPTLSEGIARRAIDHLADHDMVLGPAEDGGYYLIGLSKPVPTLFHDIAWSTDQVLEQTLAAANQSDLRIALLPTLPDVDLPEDLVRWEKSQATPQSEPINAISVVIPTLNEEPLLECAIRSAKTSATTELIIVAAGQTQHSLHLAVKHRCQFLTSPPGRAKQLNAGANAATNLTLLFLHADSRLPVGFEQTVSAMLAKPGVAGGAFSLQIDAPGWTYRLIERGVAWRSRWCQMPYGDQAIFLNRDAFDRLNGFSDLPIMEDFEFIRRLQRIGKIAIAPQSVVTSARRWQALGPLRTTWMNQRIIAGYYFGVPLEKLAIWYRAEKGRHLNRERP